MKSPHFRMMIGLPASGKSTRAQMLASQSDAAIHSSDVLRKELFGSEDEQGDPNVLFKELHSRIKRDLLAGQDVIYDACNISYKRRKAFLDELKNINASKSCYLVLRSHEDCIAFNAQRERKVPNDVIRRMLHDFWIPQFYEGWDCIEHELIGNSDAMLATPYTLRDFDQCNQHHSLSLGDHMIKAHEYVVDTFSELPGSNLAIAALWHDIGKPLTKTFRNRKGGRDTDAHYYNHNNVGAYLYAMWHHKQFEFIDVAALIQWHMHPFNMERNGGEEKFKKLVGQKFYDELMLLHEADLAAH